MLQKRLATWSVFAVLIAASLAGVTLAGQTAASPTPKTEKAWTPPRGPDGHPDLSGVWEHNAATPIERPDELAGRAALTDDEVVALKQKAAELFNGDGDAAFGDASTMSSASRRGSSPGMSEQGTTTRSGSWGDGSRIGRR